jgi:hypothetical protein
MSFTYLGLFYPKTCQRWIEDLAMLASFTCDLVPFIEGTLCWYTLVCTMVGFALHAVLSCLVSCEILRGCTLLNCAACCPPSLLLGDRGFYDILVT